MKNFNSYQKSLSQLRKIGESISLIYSENKYSVDIERTVEHLYRVRIDYVPLKAEYGVEAWASINEKKIYIDIGLADSDSSERRYRFTLAEELAHIILHAPIYKGITRFEEWQDIWESMDEDIHSKLDRNAKELAGIILMPEKIFWDRLLNLRNSFYRIYNVKDTPSDEQRSRITIDVVKRLMDDFSVNEGSCRIRIQRIEMWKNRSFFEI